MKTEKLSKILYHNIVIKRIIYIIICTLTSCSIMAKSSHMKAVGVAMEGTAKEYCERLAGKGFSYNGRDGRWMLMKGKYEKIEGCFVGVRNGASKNVGDVIVMLPERGKWNILEEEYLAMKKQLKKKYGKPSSDRSTFSTMWEPQDDREKYRALRWGRCMWKCVWNTEEGEVILNLDNNGRVTITFSDKLNNQAPKKESHMRKEDIYAL